MACKVGDLQRLPEATSKAPKLKANCLAHPWTTICRGHRASGDLSGFAALVRLLFTQQNYGNKHLEQTRTLGTGFTIQSPVRALHMFLIAPTIRKFGEQSCHCLWLPLICWISLGCLSLPSQNLLPVKRQRLGRLGCGGY